MRLARSYQKRKMSLYRGKRSYALARERAFGLNESPTMAFFFAGEKQDVAELAERLKRLGISVSDAPSGIRDGRLNFSLESVLLAAGASGLIAAAATCIVTYLKERTKKCVLYDAKGQPKLMTLGMTAQDVERILHASTGATVLRIVEDDEDNEQR